MIQIETDAKVYSFQDEDSVLDSDSENDEFNPCDVSYDESDEGDDVLQDQKHKQTHGDVPEEEGAGSFGAGYYHDQSQNCL